MAFSSIWSMGNLLPIESNVYTLAYSKAALFGFVMALICYNLLAVAQAAMRSVHGADKIEAGISPYYLVDEVRRVYEGMMIAIPPMQWQPFAQFDVDTTVQFLQQLAAQMELSKFHSHPRGEQKKIPKPERQKDKPHVSTARLLSQAKSKKGKKVP